MIKIRLFEMGKGFESSSILVNFSVFFLTHSTHHYINNTLVAVIYFNYKIIWHEDEI